ncbi:MAG: aromatic hydrocarbon degradation protein [Ginsengibacter sp.]
MKILASIAILIIASSEVCAQEPADALRYSWLTQNGTARNQAIGGASGSLGGEFSTMFVNPAGIGFFKTSEFVFTPYYNMQKNKSSYRQTLEKASKNNFNLGTTGFLFSIPAYHNSNIKNFTIGLGINRVADFNSRISFNGSNNKSSYSEKYLEELVYNNVTNPDSAAFTFPFGSSLALNTYVIDTTEAADGSISGYKSLASVATGLNQQSTIITSGGVTDISLAGAVNLKDKLFLGGSLSIPVVNYDRRSAFKESDATANSSNNFNYFEVTETLKTQGFGVNGKLGVIYKPVEYVRLGLAFHSPTIYQLTDKYTAEISSDLEGYGGAGIKKQNSGVFTSDVPGESKYKLSTPWKVIASASYVFREVANVKKQRAFITADVEYVNYKAAGFEVINDANNDQADTKKYFTQLNATIDKEYKSAFNFRLGGELKFNTIMFRLGGAYYSNPYKNEKASRVKLGGGLGYRNKGIFIDVAYVHTVNKDVHYPYRLQDNSYDRAFIKNNAGNIVATIGFKI